MSAAVIITLVAGPRLLDAGRERMLENAREPALPRLTGNWSGPVPVTLGYDPEFVGASGVVAGQYKHGSQVVELRVIAYGRQEQGAELIGWRNKLFDRNKWRKLEGRVESISESDERELIVQSTLIAGGRSKLWLWHWYDVGGHATSSPQVAKLWQAWNAVTGNGVGDAIVVLAAPTADHQLTDGSAVLAKFALDHLDAIRNCLRPLPGDQRHCVIPETGVRASEQ